MLAPKAVNLERDFTQRKTATGTIQQRCCKCLPNSWEAIVQFTVRFYFFDGEPTERPIVHFLEELRREEPILHKLLVAGLKKLESGDRHGPPLTEAVDRAHGILELRVGHANIARAFFFFQRGQEIVV